MLCCLITWLDSSNHFQFVGLKTQEDRKAKYCRSNLTVYPTKAIPRYDKMAGGSYPVELTEVSKPLE